MPHFSNISTLPRNIHIIPSITTMCISVYHQLINSMYYMFVCIWSNPMGTILPTVSVIDFKPAPQIAYFSSRGPSTLSPNIIKVSLFEQVIYYLRSLYIFARNTNGDGDIYMYVAWYSSTWCGNTGIMDRGWSGCISIQPYIRNFHVLSSCFWCCCHCQISIPHLVSLCYQICHHDLRSTITILPHTINK